MSRYGSCCRPARLREFLNARRFVLTLCDGWTRVWRLSVDTLTRCGGLQASKLEGATIFFSDGPGQSFLGEWFRTRLKKAVFGSLTSDRARVSPRTLLSLRRRDARRRLASARRCSGADGQGQRDRHELPSTDDFRPCERLARSRVRRDSRYLCHCQSSTC